MRSEEQRPGDIVAVASLAEVIKSCGIQLAKWANDIAFTDAPYGRDWSIETAERMATLSELLYTFYKLYEEDMIDWEVDLPDGMTGHIAINPLQTGNSAKSEYTSNLAADLYGGDNSNIDENPF